MDALALSEHELGFSEHETFLDVQVRVSCQSKTEFCELWFRGGEGGFVEVYLPWLGLKSYVVSLNEQVVLSLIT